MSGSRKMVLGVGNRDRGDDALGRVVARALAGTLPEGFDVVEVEGEATALLVAFEGAETVYVVDACMSGAKPGTIHRIDVTAAPLPDGRFGLSTHSFGLREAIELARALNVLPPRCVVYAIEAQSFELGEPLTPAAEAAANAAARRLREELQELEEV